MNSYELSRSWFDYSFENPDKVKPIHTAIYFFAIEHCNRLGWKDKFGFPTTMVMEAIGVKSYNTYIKALNELVEFGFIKMIQVSKNQHSANIVAISKNVKANNKALDKALIKHGTKQSESTEQSIDSIDKQYNKEQETKNKEQKFDIFWDLYQNKKGFAKCKKAFMKLDCEVIEKIIESVPKYVKSTPEIKYRKLPLTWLNGEHWNDELEAPKEFNKNFATAKVNFN